MKPAGGPQQHGRLDGSDRPALEALLPAWRAWSEAAGIGERVPKQRNIGRSHHSHSGTCSAVLLFGGNHWGCTRELPHRRQFLRLTRALPRCRRCRGLCGRKPIEQADPPNRRISAGSAVDILGRIITQWLTEQLGQPVIVEARPGAGGNISYKRRSRRRLRIYDGAIGL